MLTKLLAYNGNVLERRNEALVALLFLHVAMFSLQLLVHLAPSGDLRLTFHQEILH